MMVGMYQPRRNSRSEFVPIRNLSYHVRLWGKPVPGRAPLVMVHGWMDVGASWQFVVDALADDHFIVAPDWRGFGLTEVPGADNYWFPDYLADLDFLLDHYAPGQAIDLVGHRMTFLLLGCSAAIGIALMLLRPIRMPPHPASTAGHDHKRVGDLFRIRSLRRAFVASAVLSMAWDLFTFVTPIHGTRLGLSASMIGLILGCFGAAIFLAYSTSLPAQTAFIVPFFKQVAYPLGAIGFVVMTYCVIVGTSNAVNLTDGLDGLAIMPTVMIGSALGVFAYVAGNAVFAKYLVFPYIPGAGELTVICGALAGAGLAFLWFNAYPAEVFMGDVGALALGAALGTIAVIVRQEIVLFIMGGVFVVETLSVMLQVASYKLTGKRIFRMAPLHHHYELKGWKENQVVVRFWIITMMLVLVGLSTLKLR